MHKTQDRQRTKNTTKADDNTGKMQIIWLMITMLPKRRKNASQMQKQERKKKRFTEEGRLSSLLSTKEFLLYLFASSWGQQFRACNRIIQYKNKTPTETCWEMDWDTFIGHSKEQHFSLQSSSNFTTPRKDSQLIIWHSRDNCHQLMLWVCSQVNLYTKCGANQDFLKKKALSISLLE